MNRFLILGGGMIGRYIAKSLAREGDVTLADKDDEKVYDAFRLGVDFEEIDVRDHGSLVKLMSDYDVAVSAVERPEFHLLGLKAAIEAGCNFTDLGADPTTLNDQFKLHEEAKEAGITAIPDTGVSPGLTNILVGMGAQKFDNTRYIRYFVGALPQNPTNPPLNYALVFSIAVLVNEYFEASNIIKDGIIEQVEGMSGLEQIPFPGVGTFEAAFVAGQTSTLTRTFAGEVDELYEKTLRYPGHYQEIQRLAEMFKGRRDFLERHLLSNLPRKQPDMLLMKVTVGGEKAFRKAEMVYTLVHKYDRDTCETATATTTSRPAAIVAQMIADGRICEKGVLEQEIYVPKNEFRFELNRRGIIIEEELVVK